LVAGVFHIDLNCLSGAQKLIAPLGISKYFASNNAIDDLDVMADCLRVTRLMLRFAVHCRTYDDLANKTLRKLHEIICPSHALCKRWKVGRFYVNFTISFVFSVR